MSDAGSSLDDLSVDTDDGGILIDLTVDEPVVVGNIPPIVGPPLLIDLVSDSSRSQDEDDGSVESRDSMADLADTLDLSDEAFETAEEDALLEEEQLEEVAVVRQVPEMHVEVEMTGQAWKSTRERRQIAQLALYLPEENISYSFETYLVFQEQILLVREIREHPDCFGCWRVDGAPILVGGQNIRFQFQNLPHWVLRNPQRMMMEGRNALDTFYAKMDFFWQTHLAPGLCARLVDRVRDNGDGGGLQAVAVRDCTAAEMRICMTGFLEEISEKALWFLSLLGHSSLVRLRRVGARDHCAILFGMGRFCEHRCFADVRLSNRPGPPLSLMHLQAGTPWNPVGYVIYPHGHRPLRWVFPVDEDIDTPYRTHWVEGERVCKDYAGSAEWAGEDPVFECDCVYCLE